MPDDRLNLTDAESRALGYRRRRDAPPPPPPMDDFGDAMEALGPILTAIVLFAIVAGGIALAYRQFTTTTAVAATNVAPSTPAPPQPQAPQASSASEAAHTDPVQQVQPDTQPDPEKYLLGWNYLSTSGDVPVHNSQNEVTATIPSGTEILVAWESKNGWSFVVTLDGGTWGWVRFAETMTPHPIPMDGKFDIALDRVRTVNTDQAPPPVYLPDGWGDGVTDGPITLFEGDGGRTWTVQAGREFLYSFATSNGWSFVVTPDGGCGVGRVLRPKCRKRSRCGLNSSAP